MFKEVAEIHVKYSDEVSGPFQPVGNFADV